MAKSQPTTRIGERSAKTGQFVKDGTAEKRPNTTVRERIPLPGHGDTFGRLSAPRCPWWPYVWSVRTLLKTGTDGRISIGAQRIRLEHPKGVQVVLCLHATGHHSVLAAPPDKNHKPALLFTNRPK